jgi:phosphoglycerol transferase
MLIVGASWGLGFLISFWVTTVLRGYNRTSIVISMLALLAVGAVVDWYCRRFADRKWVAVAVALVLLGVGLVEQTSPANVPAYAANSTAYRTDLRFGSAVQKALPAGSMVFQLPYVQFPGAAAVLPAGFGDYDHLLPYIYSDGLRWSFGAMRGRANAKWQADVSALPVPRMLERIKSAGFSAVYVDRLGYTDHGKQIVADLTAALGKPAVKSSDGRMLLWRTMH